MFVFVNRAIAALVLALALLLSDQMAFATPANAATQIQSRYDSDASLRNMLGAPSGPEFSIANGKQRNYKWGSLYWSQATGVKEVHGAIRWRYQLLGGPNSFLGFPTTDEGRVFIKYDVPEQQVGARSDFQNGAVTWNKSSNKTFWVGKTIAENLPYYTFPYYGLPESDERGTSKGARVVNAGGLMYATSKGFFHIHDGYPSGSNGILAKYQKLGAEKGLLGLPVSAEAQTSSEGRVRKFEWGNIYQCGLLLGSCSDQAYEVHGAILWRFNLEGGVAKLGFPISDEQDATGGRISYFQRGEVFWNSKTDKTSVRYY